MSDNSLSHFGVLGMRWGVRKKMDQKKILRIKEKLSEKYSALDQKTKNRVNAALLIGGILTVKILSDVANIQAQKALLRKLLDMEGKVYNL